MLALAASGAAHADAVTHWNGIAETHAVLPVPPKTRALAMVQIAVHDALNAIAPRYAAYTVIPSANPNASPEAAVAAAARDVLMAVAPEAQRPAVQAKYAAYLATLPACQAGTSACAQGIAAGQSAAAAILAARIGDHADAPPIPYTPAPGPGVYQPTPAPTWNQLATPAFAQWAAVTPFVLRAGEQFRVRPSRLMDLSSARYAFDYNEVKTLGSAAARRGTPEKDQSEPSRIARFWYGSGGTWYAAARAIAEQRQGDLWQHARLFALLSIAQADAVISVFESKYHYNFWRPVTAISWTDDGNPHTAPDPDWLPYLVTPAYPDYPCGTPMLAGAATEVLRRELGSDRIAYTVTSQFAAQNGLPAEAVTRSYRALSQAAAESAAARVYAGIHFRTGCDIGVRQGERIGHYVVRSALQPLGRPRR